MTGRKFSSAPSISYVVMFFCQNDSPPPPREGGYKGIFSQGIPRGPCVRWFRLRLSSSVPQMPLVQSENRSHLHASEGLRCVPLVLLKGRPPEEEGSEVQLRCGVAPFAGSCQPSPLFAGSCQPSPLVHTNGLRNNGG